MSIKFMIRVFLYILNRIFGYYKNSYFSETKEFAYENAKICPKCGSKSKYIFPYGIYYCDFADRFLVSKCSKCDYEWETYYNSTKDD